MSTLSSGTGSSSKVFCPMAPSSDLRLQSQQIHPLHSSLQPRRRVQIIQPLFEYSEDRKPVLLPAPTHGAGRNSSGTRSLRSKCQRPKLPSFCSQLGVESQRQADTLASPRPILITQLLLSAGDRIACTPPWRHPGKGSHFRRPVRLQFPLSRIALTVG